MSLDFLLQNKEFKRLVQAIRQGERGVTISGIAEPAKPYVLACLAHELDGPLVVVRPTSSSLTEFTEGCQFFLSQFSSGSTAAALPGLASDPYEDIPPSLDVVARRMKFLRGLKTRTPSVIVTNLPGLLKPFPGPENLDGLFLVLEKGLTFGRDELIGRMAEFGYAREEIIASHGEYAWRGGIVDIFSPWEDRPFRVEFSGDAVASLRTFEPSSQRSLERRERVVIPSLREFPGTREFFDRWRAEALKRAGKARDDVEARSEALARGDISPSFHFEALILKEDFVSFDRYLPQATYVVDDFEEVESEWSQARDGFQEHIRESGKKRRFTVPAEEVFSPERWAALSAQAVLVRTLGASSGPAAFALGLQSVPRFDNKIPFFQQYMKKLQRSRDRCLLFLTNEAMRKKFGLLLAQSRVTSTAAVSALAAPSDAGAVLLLGSLEHGFCAPEEKVYILAERDVLTEEKVITSRLAAAKPFLSHFQDLKTGDYVVHTDCGIGLFQGMLKMDVEAVPREFIELHYKDEDKLYVPVEDLNLVQKYTPVGAALPPLDKLGTPSWEKTKEKAKRAVQRMAKELLELYAQRKAANGHAFSPSGDWAAEFGRTFEYEETEDQLRSIKDIEKDMESPSPMDRLLCGDVGYGKTEVAMRAAFKAVMDGTQVAVLCPTTVLASQHLKTLRARLVLFPVRVEALSRLQSKAEQAAVLTDLKKGRVDIIIGTHRLLSSDVSFQDLGLLVVDEEQRFGVSHKEKIKRMKATVDVLTLTATPIPRTLNLSLSGLRDISLIETPPRDRLAVHTVVTTFSLKLIAAAIKQELRRGGQVYYIHNRIEDIDQVAALVVQAVPEAKVTTIHGQMSSGQLERRMIDFIGQASNVLVSTTIIENGIDIPLVNTLIVDRADLYGLAQLYQLRGRVGRSSRQAYAYFLVPPFAELSPLARERLKALKEFSELGSGFRLAAKDLEIRGAGNLLGFEQHGNMAAVGFDYFMHLLDEAIRELRGEPVEDTKPEVNLRVSVRIPEPYLPQVNLRLSLYKRVSSIESLDELKAIEEEVRDRFGPPPPSVQSLFHYGVIKHLAQVLRVRSIDRVGRRLVIKFAATTTADLSRMTKLMKARGGSITPQGVLTVSLRAETEDGLLRETIDVLKEF